MRFWIVYHGYNMFVIRAPSAAQASACVVARGYGRTETEDTEPEEISIDGSTEIVAEYIL